MIHFLHGGNQAQSRARLIQLLDQAKVENREIIRLDGEKINLNDLIQALESSSLFGQDKLVVIENLFSRPASKQKKQLTDYLKKATIKPELVLWERKKVSGTTTRWLPENWQFKAYKTPAVVFKFLDALKPGQPKPALKFLKETIELESSQMAFYMLARRVKNLIIAADLGKKGLKGAPWQKAKLVKQANQFSLVKLIEFHQRLLDIDLDIKTGRSPMPLDWHLDILVIGL